MSYRVLSIAWVACLLFTGCKEDAEFKFNSPKKLKIDSPLSLSVTETNGNVIDSVVFYLNGLKTSTKNPYTLDISKKTLGKHTLSAVVYHEGKSKRLNNSIYFLADKAPILYNYEIVNTYPHDPKAFTQGFEFHNGHLYESTGQKGQSSIRKTALKTGKVLQKQSLDAAYLERESPSLTKKYTNSLGNPKKGLSTIWKAFNASILLPTEKASKDGD